MSNVIINPTYPSNYYDYIRKINLTFRQVQFEDDVAMLHSWMKKAHVVPYWNLDISLQDYKRHLLKFQQDQHQTLLIGEIDGVPVSYWESYWVKGDIIENYYKFDQYDQGIHLPIGPEEYLGKGYIYPLLLSILHHKFKVSQTQKIIAEPDIRNKKMIHVFKKCGFTPVHEVKLPDKTGLLMFCERSDFESRWNDWQQNKF